jgi:hypothetical protein
MASEEIEQQLAALRNNYQEVEGRPFEHFCCPILLREEPAELCKGHVINQKIRNSTRLWVVQRKDVDGFFGRVFESDVVAMVESRDRHLADTLSDKDLSRKVEQRVTVDGKTIPHYRASGCAVPPNHSSFELRSGDRAVPMVLRMSPDEVDERSARKWQFELSLDCRLAGRVSVIKAAHLSMFRLFGYSYALSAGGIHVGKDILGSFFLKHSRSSDRDARKAGLDHFAQYVNMVRPVEHVGDLPSKGTVEDGKLGVCLRPSGQAFAFIVFVRTAHHLHAALVPAFPDPGSVAAYLSFLGSDETTIRVASGWYDSQARVLKAEQRVQVFTWNKENPRTALVD